MAKIRKVERFGDNLLLPFWRPSKQVFDSPLAFWRALARPRRRASECRIVGSEPETLLSLRNFEKVEKDRVDIALYLLDLVLALVNVRKGIFIIEIKAQSPAVPFRPDLPLFAKPSFPEINIVLKPTTLPHTRPFSFHQDRKALLFADEKPQRF